MAKVDMLMPQMGESITEGTVIKWHKREGQSVEKDEILLEISTDKVDSEIPSPYAGTIEKILVNEGETVQVGAVIAHIETEADVAAAAETTSTAPSQPAEAVAAPPAAETLATAASESSATATAPAEGTADMVMPQMGESITEGTIIKWLKNEGEHVEIDELLLEISTDKVDSEIPSPHAGTLQKILAKAGETVSVGAVIAQIATKGQIAVGASGIQQPAIMTDPQTPPPVQPRPVAAAPAVAAATARTNGTERRFYSPLVRRIAKAEGVSDQDLTGIEGTGVGGRVTKKDILNYLDKRTGVPAAASAQPAAPAYTPATQPLASNDLVEIIPMSSMRKSIAKHMIASVQTSPHVFMVTEADMTDLVIYRTQNKEKFLQQTGTKLTYMSFFSAACARALQDYPLVNSSLDGDNIVRKKYINIGIAVALENNGLIVPVVKSADNLNIVGLARAINDLANRARSKKLKPDEVQDGTFSITNMGTFGSLYGLAIINQPQVAILGVGTIQKRPVVIDDAIAIRNMLYLSLSFDHRIVDGALAGQFIERVAYYLTNFDTNNII